MFTGIDDMLAAIEQREWRHAAKGASREISLVAGYGIDTEDLHRQLDLARNQYVEVGLQLAALEETEAHRPEDCGNG